MPPWEKYQATATPSTGAPWTKYQKTAPVEEPQPEPVGDRSFWEKTKDFGAGIGQSFKDTALGAMQAGLDVADLAGVESIGGLDIKDLRGGGSDVAAQFLKEKQQAEQQGRNAFGYGNIAGDVLQTIGLPAGAGSLAKMAVAGAGAGGVYGLTRPEEEQLTAGQALLERGGEGLKHAAIGGVAAPVVGGAISAVSRAAPKVGAMIADESGSVGGRKISSISPRMQDLARNTAKSLGLSADDLTDDVMMGFGKYRSERYTPQQALDKAIADKYGVSLSRGDITRNVIQQGEEDLALKGVYGQQAKDLAEGFRKTQTEQLAGGAANLMERTSGRGLGLVDELGEQIGQGIKSKAASAKEAGTAAYEAAKQGRAFLSNPAESLTQFGIKARESLADLDVELMPRVQKRLDEIDAFAKLVSDKGVSGVSLKSMEKFRSRLATGANATGDRAEALALKKLKDTYDDFLNESIDNGLITGDAKVVDQLKKARSLWADYRKTFTEDKVISKIVDGDLTPESTLQLLTGAGKLGANKESANVVNSLKNILGENSAEYGAFKQAAMQKIFGDNWKNYIYGEMKGFSGAQLSKNLRALETENPTLLKSIFTPAEYNEIKSFSRVASAATERVPGAINTSNTTPALLRWLNSAAGAVPGGKYLAGGVQQTARGLGNASKRADLEAAFSGKLPIGERYPANSFAAGLAAKTGGRGGASAVERVTEGMTNGVADKYPTKLTIPNPDQQSSNTTTPPTSTMAANPAPTKGRRNGGGVQAQEYINLAKSIASEQGVNPALVAAVVRQESEGDPSAVSPAGARGLMQLMPETAKELGVNPDDPQQNIQGGVKYLKQLQKKYKNETLALMAYNWGMGNVDKWMQRGRNIKEIPSETRNYLQKVTGYKQQYMRG